MYNISYFVVVVASVVNSYIVTIIIIHKKRESQVQSISILFLLIFNL